MLRVLEIQCTLIVQHSRFELRWQFHGPIRLIIVGDLNRLRCRNQPSRPVVDAVSEIKALVAEASDSCSHF